MFWGVDGRDLYNMTSLKTKKKKEKSKGERGENPSLANLLPRYPLLLPCIDNAFRQMDIPSLLFPSFTIELHSFYHYSFLLLRNFIVSFFIPLFSTFIKVFFFERFHSKMFLASLFLSDINFKLHKNKRTTLTKL